MAIRSDTKSKPPNVIVSAAFWQCIKIQLSAFIFGSWLLFTRLLKWCWNPKSFFNIQPRDYPPACLVDGSFGRHSYIKLKGIKLHFVEAGSKDSPLVVLLHGFPDFWLSWRYQINELSKHFLVIAIDLKGFGDSDKPSARHHYRVELILSELKHFIKSRGVSSCVIIGHDLGAMIGWYMCHRYPDMVKKFVSVSCPHPNIYWRYLNDRCYFNRRWLYASQLPYFPEMDMLKQDINILDTFYPHLNSPSTHSFIDAYKYTFSRAEDWTGPLNYFRTLVYSQINHECDAIAVPTLLIVGGVDPLTKLESIVKSTDFCERFYVKVVDGAGHFPHQEKPREFNELLVNFLVEKPRKVARVEGLVSPGKGIMDRMLGAVSNTVKYGNSVFDVVQKNGVMTGNAKPFCNNAIL